MTDPIQPDPNQPPAPQPPAPEPTAPEPTASEAYAQQYAAQQQAARPQYTQPEYAQPQYAQPQYAQPQYGQPQYAQPAAWQPGFGPWPYATHPDDAPTPGVGFTQAVRLFFKKYAQFSGRASRSEFWWVALFTAIVTLALYLPGLVLATIGGVMIAESSTASGGVIMLIIGIVLIGLMLIFSLAILVPSIAIAVRRLHDANFSGFFYLLSLVGLSIVVLVMNVLDSNPAGQRFDRPI